MLTTLTQSALVTGLQVTVGQSNAAITAAVTSLLALNTTQTASFSTYITSIDQTTWQDVVNAISALAVTDYPNLLPTIANKTPLDIQVLINTWSAYLTLNMPTDLQAFMLAINPTNILIVQGLISTVPASDFMRRLIALFPNYWAGDTALQPGGNLYALFMACAVVLNIVSTLLQTTQESFYLTSADGTALDITVGDFFGTSLPRNSGETDASYRARVYQRIFEITDTRPGLYTYMNLIAPTRLIEPWAPSDTGVYDAIIAYAGNPNGFVAGYVNMLVWDTTDSELWVCTATGTAATAVWAPAPTTYSIGGAYYDFDTLTIPGRYTNAGDRYQGFADVSLSSKESVPLAVYTLWTDGTSPSFAYIDAQTVNSIGEAQVPPINYASYIYPVAVNIITPEAIYSAILAAKALGVQVWCKFI